MAEQSISYATRKEGVTSTSPAGEEEDSAGKLPLPIVGVGASAGGLDAFNRLLADIPETTGMGFVLVQHLDPGHESLLSELLSRVTGMAVCEAVDGQHVLANHVYVIPPGTTISLSHGALRLAPRNPQSGPHLPIDIFFRSLADHNGGRAIGIILSGMGSDGSQGLEEIKAAGGITFAQDPASAGHAGMPQSAIDEGNADFVLPPAGIGKELIRIAGLWSRVGTGPEAGAVPSGTDGLSRVLDLVRTRMNADFSRYRDSTFRRRIFRRMTVRQRDTLKDYSRLLESDPAEMEALYKDMLINVTRFFRDPETFEFLKRSVFPEILKAKPPETPIRIWVTGCSSGQEAYTLAILLLEFLADTARPPPFQIFASDLSENGSLAKAREGLYPLRIESDVSPERLRRFFTKEEQGYRIRKDIRSHCIFAKHDLVADPPFSHVDLITCRNVLIYMSPSLQRKVIPIFHYALNPGGFLMLGSSESAGDTDLFKAVDRDRRIYVRNPAASRPPHFPVKQHATPSLPGLFPSGSNTISRMDFRRESDRILLARFPPPCVLVDAELEILQFRGRTRSYLEPAQGEASFNLLKMAHESLYLDLRSAVQEAKDRGEVAERKDVRIRDGGRFKTLRLEVIPIVLPGTKEMCFLILFEEAAEEPPADETEPEVDPLKADDLAQSRKEAASLREFLQAVREQHDYSIEALRTSNEELLSSNEEMQSTNEEMETAKEELQSANEALITVNEEMSQRGSELAYLNNDLTNLLDSINVPIVIVGRDLRIRRFTAAAGKILHLIPADLGRPLADLHWDLFSPDPGLAVSEVMETGRPQDHEVRNREGRWQSLRIHPYRTSDGRIDGAVIILMDIDALRTTQDRLNEEKEYARSIVATVREPLLILREDLRVNTANASFYKMFGAAPGETEGFFLFKTGDAKWNVPGLREAVEACLFRNEPFDGFAMNFEDPVAGPRNLLLNGRTLLRETGKARMVLLSIEDIADRLRAQEALKSQSTILERAVLERTSELRESNEEMEAFSYSVSHDLRAPLRAMQGYAEALLKDLGERVDPDSKALLGKIVQSGARMDSLILDVLTYSRTALADVPIRAVDLDSLVREVIRIDPDLQAPEISLCVDGPLARVMGHAGSLSQCLSNLLQNAVKFVDPAKPARVRIFTEPKGPDVRLWIEDNGIGIDPGQHGRIFGMFEMLNGTSTYAGTGIGLAIVRKSIKRMGGSVGLESESGRGSRFWLQLPKAGEA